LKELESSLLDLGIEVTFQRKSGRKRTRIILIQVGEVGGKVGRKTGGREDV
jgi:hypothetical protein